MTAKLIDYEFTMVPATQFVSGSGILGCERGRRWISIYSIAIKYFKVVGMIKFFVYVTDFALKRRKIYSFFKKNVVYIGKIWATIL